MDIQTTAYDSKATLRLKGRFQFDSHREFRSAYEPYIEDPAIRVVVIDFSGVDMDMGYNRPLLQEATDGVFKGEATLPVCVTGRMTWQATVLVETGRTRIAVPFRFVTGE